MRLVAPPMSVPCSFSGSGAFGRAEHHVAAHAGGQVQHHVDIGVADALGHLAVEDDVAARLAGFGVAHMAMDDRGTGLCGVDRRVGDLLGRARHMRAAVLRAARAGDGAGDEDLAVHGKRHDLSPIDADHHARRLRLPCFAFYEGRHGKKRKTSRLSGRARRRSR